MRCEPAELVQHSLGPMQWWSAKKTTTQKQEVDESQTDVHGQIRHVRQNLVSRTCHLLLFEGPRPISPVNKTGDRKQEIEDRKPPPLCAYNSS